MLLFCLIASISVIKFYGFFFDLTNFERIGQKNAQNFVGFLEYGKTPKIPFEIY